MVNMELDEKEGKKESVEAMENLEPKYPWGLQISLDNESMEKLGIEDEKFKVGEEYTIECRVKVIGVNEDETINDGVRKNMRCQIVEMEWSEGDGTTEPEKMAKKMYRKKG